MAENTENTENIWMSDRPDCKDAVGVVLKPYTRIHGSGDDFYVRTRDLLDHIDTAGKTADEKDNETWDKGITSKLLSKSVSLKEIEQQSRNYMTLYNEEPNPHWSVADHNKDKGGNQARYHRNFENICETISYGSYENKRDAEEKSKEISMSFVPANIETSRVLSIYSSLDPIPVIQKRTDDMFKDHENTRYYAKGPLLKKMHENGYMFHKQRISRDNRETQVVLLPSFDLKDPESLRKPKDPVPNMESILQQLEPITVKPVWSKKKNIHLSHHLSGGKIRETTNNYIRIDEKKENVAGFFYHTEIPIFGVAEEMHSVYGDRYPNPEDKKQTQAGMER